jgi:hypothetical protein
VKTDMQSQPTKPPSRPLSSWTHDALPRNTIELYLDGRLAISFSRVGRWSFRLLLSHGAGNVERISGRW